MIYKKYFFLSDSSSDDQGTPLGSIEDLTDDFIKGGEDTTIKK